jgi:hypothetical protein
MSEKSPEDPSVSVTTTPAAPPPSQFSIATSKLQLKWNEFRKRYLTVRRVLFWTIWIFAHTALFVYGWSVVLPPSYPLVVLEGRNIHG